MNKQITISPLDFKFFESAVALSYENYLSEATKTEGLNDSINKSYFFHQLEPLFKQGIGKMAFEESVPVGFIAFKKAGTESAISPLCGYGIRHENRSKIAGKLFQETAAELCRDFIRKIRVNVYAHDADVMWMYIMSAFSMDLTDVVRTTQEPIDAEIPDTFTFREIGKVDLLKHKNDIIELYRSLINHLRLSPVFYHCRDFLPIENRFDDFLNNNIRVFAVFDDNSLAGMINAEPCDGGFGVNDSNALNMGDVFIKPEYRGQGLAAALLRFANDELEKSSIQRLYVTHGTINPTARGFWDRYFTNYSYTMTRTINKDMLGNIELF